MKRALAILALAIALIAVSFYLLNAYIYEEKQEPNPVPEEYAGWTAARTNDVSFYYPDPFPGSDYVSASEWPPRVEKIVPLGNCAVGEGSVDGIPSIIEERIINERLYCTSVGSEGAAGSLYTTYAYTEGEYSLTFTLRYPQCMNYDEPNRTACMDAQESIDLDALADRILQSASQ